MQFTNEELGRILNWFNNLDQIEQNFMKDGDRELALKIAQALGKPTEPPTRS